MTRTPPEPPDEELDELDDEAIVAQQSAAHAPQRRTEVKVESRSVVVADQDAEATRQLEIYTEGTADPTVVVRDRDRRAMSQAMAELSGRPRARKPWVTFAIWGGAGLLALSLGAGLMMVHEEPATSTAAPAARVVPASVRPAAPSPSVARQGSETDAAAPSDSSAAEPALAPDQLPVEHRKRHKVHVHARRAAAAPQPQPAPAPQPAVKPSPPQIQPKSDQGAIPSGI